MPVCSVFFKIVIMCGAGDARKIVTFVPNCHYLERHYLEQKFSFLFKIHFLVRAHQTTTAKTKLLRIRPTMATLILAQYNNQPTISRH
jgi:hypothetical protein